MPCKNLMFSFSLSFQINLVHVTAVCILNALLCSVWTILFSLLKKAIFFQLLITPWIAYIASVNQFIYSVYYFWVSHYWLKIVNYFVHGKHVKVVFFYFLNLLSQENIIICKICLSRKRFYSIKCSVCDLWYNTISLL